eukprot:3562636-Amphidinium_carterae.1
MALLQHYEAWEDLTAYWSMLASFTTSPQVALAWTSRLGCEQVFYQLGARPAYVPSVALHIDGI